MRKNVGNSHIIPILLLHLCSYTIIQLIHRWIKKVSWPAQACCSRRYNRYKCVFCFLNQTASFLTKKISI
nr:MAG TPA: Kappa-conotoxin PVIIA knot, inhibitor, TOXIN [Caudoviricetes sp.]